MSKPKKKPAPPPAAFAVITGDAREGDAAAMVDANRRSERQRVLKERDEEDLKLRAKRDAEDREIRERRKKEDK